MAKSKKSNRKNVEIPKAYDSDIEMEMYELWEKSGFFNPDKIKTRKKPFVISLPPPNANGELHIGHTCGYSFQDCMGRYNRMKGRPTLLFPGKDHAGIQTEAVFTQILKEKGVDKWELGRDKFYKQAYDFCIEKSDHARDQEKRIGLSADWSREKFTLDPELTDIIYETFFQMFEQGLVYRGSYIINQCTHCGTALANIDTEHVLKNGILVYIKYPMSESGVESITVATTRPETMLGDTAVAVNPKDKRYKKLVGKSVNLPLADRKIPIIADRSVTQDFGTGALKVTPAHSTIDFEIGREHELEVLNVIDEKGLMNENAPKKYQGMNVKDCRKAVIEDLKSLGLIEKIESIEHEVVVCERCKHDIEQIISKQWFVKAEPLAAEAIKALDKGETKVIPEYQHKVLKQWLENIRPWCISRQLWWGQRIPIWYCGGKKLYDWLLENPNKTKDDYEKVLGEKVKGCGALIPGADNPGKCPKCKSQDLEAEQDCFDTWYSSGQWPFTTLGGLKSKDFGKFYPTDVMETARDILFFWVARMMMLGIYRTGKTPFHHVYLHGMILASDGQKMSKARGNGVEPAEVFAQFGADALRLWYFTDTSPGQNTPIREEKLKGNRNFVNKIWNASRYVMLQVQDLEDKEIKELSKIISNKIAGVSKTDDEWEKGVYSLAEKVTKHLDSYRFNLAVECERDFFWHTFCDKWIEETKNLISENEDKKVEYLGRLVAILCVQLKLMHPFVPFVTETVWQSLKSMGLLTKESELLMVSEWPCNSKNK
ncbi:MAG: valine--tRNA ligase [Patescibacteria group bacterium]|nr:valine--tRNA ligase [Patescibacteria group bacterium]